MRCPPLPRAPPQASFPSRRGAGPFILARPAWGMLPAFALASGVMHNAQPQGWGESPLWGWSHWGVVFPGMATMEETEAPHS